ncbi:MAG: metallophosphoesterase [Bacilli bacterium]|nr:metallophosphoesterase [Bacilli bacterium]
MAESRTEKNSDIADEILEEERKLRNKKIFKILMWIFIPLFIIFTVSYTCLRYIGNIGIVVREYPVYSDDINEELNGLKIVQFSDIHYGKNSSIKDIKKLVNLINEINPDIVIFTGDLIDEEYIISNDDKESIMSEFNRITSNIGKFAIRGEEDFDDFKDIFDNSNFTILENKIEKIYIGKSTINLIAVDDTYSKEELTLSDANYSIGVIHKPDLADQVIDDYEPNMIIAGHSHNGQVILPLIGPVIKKEGAKKYISSHYDIDGIPLYISGGLGNSYYPFRLLNHPSINLYRLRTK